MSVIIYVDSVDRHRQPATFVWQSVNEMFLSFCVNVRHVINRIETLCFCFCFCCSTQLSTQAEAEHVSVPQLTTKPFGGEVVFPVLSLSHSPLWSMPSLPFQFKIRNKMQWSSAERWGKCGIKIKAQHWNQYRERSKWMGGETAKRTRMK